MKTELFNSALALHSMNKGDLCKALKMRPSTLSKRIANPSSWKLGEMKSIAKIFGIETTINIFFD